MVTKLTLPRCYHCRLHLAHCLCDQIHAQKTATRVVILTHWGEKRCVTNTGHLAQKCLANCEIRWRGNPDRSAAFLEDLLSAERNAHVLFPSPGAPILNADFKASQQKPVTLIALDGNWGQASHMLRRERVLQRLPKVILPPGPTSEYHLRRNQKSGNVCTFEAIARALGQLESADLQKSLESVFQSFIARSLKMRGKFLEDYQTV